MDKETRSKRSIFLAAVAGFALVVISGTSCSKTLIDRQVDFLIEREYSSDDNSSPFFYSSILAVCANSRYIYVADWKESHITIYDGEMSFVRRFGKRGQGPGEFSQIFADIKCDEDHIYILTINRLYVFSDKGEYQDDIVLGFIPRRVFLYEDGWLFRVNDNREAIFLTNTQGQIQNKFYVVPLIAYGNCPPSYATPEIFVSQKGAVYTMDALSYWIRCWGNADGSVQSEMKRKTDFDPKRCQELNPGKSGNQYRITGGYSWFLERGDQLLYIFPTSGGELGVDSYTNDNRLLLNWSARYPGEFYPLAVMPDGRIIGSYRERNHILAVSSLKLQPRS